MRNNKPNPFVIQESGGPMKKHKISGFKYRQREGSDFPGSHQATSLGLPFHPLYMTILVVILMIVSAIIIGKIVYLQIIKHETYKTLAEGNRAKIERIIAPRGIIFDRNNTPLVSNTARFSLKAIPANLPRTQSEREKIAQIVNRALEKDSYTIQEFSNIKQHVFDVILSPDQQDPIVVLSSKLDYKTALYFKLEEALPGILLEQGIERTYSSKSASHILGYLGKIKEEEWEIYEEKGYTFGDYLGRAGLELQYEEYLRGQNEKITYEVDVRGNEQKILSLQKLVPGNNLVLSLDVSLQKHLAQTLETIARPYGDKAAAVALDPSSGAILALVSIPTFDNNMFATRNSSVIQEVLTDPKQPLFNRTISGTYPPGSTFKPVVAAAALTEGIVAPQTSFYSTGGLQLSQWFFPDWKSEGHGRTNLSKAIAESVNTYFYYIGGGFEDFDGLGVARINKHASRFGFGNTLGIDLPGEQPGFLPTKQWKEERKNEPWYIGDTYHLSIGQGDILATPLQIAAMTAALANGGTLYQPYIVSKITNETNTSIKTITPTIIKNQVADKEHVVALQKALRETILTGSARSLQMLPVSSAGKTGTAQVGGEKEPHSWFTVFAPYENPEIALTIVIENGGGSGNTASVVARTVLQEYFSKQ